MKKMKDFTQKYKELMMTLRSTRQEEDETNAQIHYSWGIRKKSLAEKIKTKAKLRKATKSTDNYRSYVGHWVPQQMDDGWWIF